MSYTIQWRRDTAANWVMNNPVLAAGEAGLETDTAKVKLGDGVTAWGALAYWAGGAGSGGGAVSSVNTQTGAVVLTASSVGADVSGAAAGAQGAAQTFATAAVATETTRAEAAEALKAPLASPALTGTPTATTAATSDSTTQVATDAFVHAAITAQGLGSAATQPTSAFDAAGAASAAQAAAIAASLPTLAAVTVSASGTLTLNRTTEVTAATALTMTLPASVANSLVVCERAAASTANVAVTGNIRGVAATTVTLQLASESEMFFGDGTTWWPVAGHKTLSSLQALFDASGAAATAQTAAQAFATSAVGTSAALAAQKANNLSDLASPGAALGNIGGAGKPQATDRVIYVSKNGSDSSDGLSWGTAKLTVAAAFAAMPNGGVLNQGAGTWYESELVPPSNLIWHGAGANYPTQTSVFANALSTYPSGDLFALPVSWNNCAIDGVVFQSGTWNGGGHIFNGATSGSTGLLFVNCYFIQNNPGSCIWYTTNATLINATWRNCWCELSNPATATATVPGFWLISSAGGIESLTFENIWWTYTGNYAIVIDSTAAGTYSQGHAFRNFTWEMCTGGLIKLLGTRFAGLENLIAYDNSYGLGPVGTILQDGYYFGRGGGNLPCYNIDVRNVNRLAGFLAARIDTTSVSTNSTTTVTDTAAAAIDLNRVITGPGIPAGTTVTAVTAGVGYTISQAATATATGLTFTVTPPSGTSSTDGQLVHAAGQCGTTLGSTVVTDTAAAASDAGRPISGPGIPAGAFIVSVTSGGGVGYTISAAATAAAASGTVNFTVTTAVDIRFASVARSQIALSQGGTSSTIIDLGGQDVLTLSMGMASATQIINRSGLQSMDVTPVSGVMLSPGYSATGLTGAVAASRYAGAIASGTAPASGTFLTGDWVVSQAGAVYICTSGGTSGTWVQSGTTAPAYSATGLAGATAGTRLVGAVASGAPTTGTFLTGDFVISLAGNIYICTAGGTPGTWAGGGSLVMNTLASNVKAGALAAVAGASGLAADASHQHPNQDPLMMGMAQTFLPCSTFASQVAVANAAFYFRLLSGGYLLGYVNVSVNVSSGNVCAGVYTNTGTGSGAKPGAQLQTSGSVACPATGAASITLGSTCTPNMNDWLAVGCDNATASFYGTSGVATNFAQGGVYEQTGLTGAVLPAPAGTLINTTARVFYLRGQ